nr:uncharacterized protein LOC129281706 [Lytechinus pictus]
MGCVNSTPVQERNGEVKEQLSIAPSQPFSLSGMTESASWTPGEKNRAKMPPMPTLPDYNQKAPIIKDNPTHLPPHPKKVDVSKLDVPALSKLLSDNRKNTEQGTASVAPQVPFMAPSSEGDKPNDPNISRKSKHAKVIITSPFDSSVRYSVEDPSDVVFGADAFPRGEENLSADDTIWSKKREFMPSYKYVKSLDKRALKAPEELRRGKPEKIVSYLTKGAKNDFQRFRVLFRWVAHAISYEVHIGPEHEDHGISPLDVLQSGKADSCGYSNLLQYLCSLASLTCEVVVGYSKNLLPGKTPFAHAWNRIRLNGRWYLSDCTAASYPSDSSCCPDKFREYEFLADPQYFHSRHLPAPLDRYGEPVPYTSLQHFNIQPTFGALASLCNLKVQSHNLGVIRADDQNHVRITMTSSVPMITWTSLTASTDFIDHRDHAVQWWDGNVLHSNLDLPHNGIWDFKVFGQLVCDISRDRDPNAVLPPTVIDTGHCHLVAFTIIAKGGVTNPPLICPDSGMCGSMITCAQVRPLTHVSPFLDAEYGKAVVGFITDDYRVKLVYRFFNVDNFHRFISNHVYMERVGDRVMVHVFCPAPGRYVLRMLINTSGKDYSRQGEYLIKDTGEKETLYSMTFSQTMGFNVWGPNENFADYGMKVTSGHSSSTIIATEGEVQLKMSWPTSKDLVLSCCLQDVKQDDRLQSRRVIIHTTSDSSKSISVTTFHIRMRETGYFVLQVYARPKECTQNKRVGGWLLVVRTMSNKPRFPVEGLICGPNDIFYRLGMRTSVSKLETSDGKGHIDISYDSDVGRTFRYNVTSATRDGYDVIAVQTKAIKQHSVFLTLFHFVFPEPNVYAIRIMTLGEGYEWNTIGSWIIIYDPSISSTSDRQLR